MAEPVSLPPGSDNPPDQAGQPFTEEDVETVGLALCLNASEPVCPRVCRDCAQEGSVVLRALAEAGRLLPAGTQPMTEFASETVLYDGRRMLAPGRDEGYARLIVESLTAHLASLNEPTKRHGGIESVRLVRREVRSWPDGSQWTGPWEVVQ